MVKDYVIPISCTRYKSLGEPDLENTDIKRAFYIGYGDGGVIGVSMGVEARLNSLRRTAELMGFNEVNVILEVEDEE
nr:MAG: hypothetical protein 1 [Guangxi cystovirus 2]